MLPDDFIKLVDKPDFISGIHNYCDRRCNKCSFISRCTVGTMEQLLQFGRDTEEPVTMEEFSGMLEIATGTEIDPENVHHISIDISELMDGEEEGIEEGTLLNDVPENESSDFMRDMKFVMGLVESHEIIAAVHPYTLECHKWKSKLYHYFHQEIGPHGASYTYIGKYEIKSDADKKRLCDAFETMEWFAAMVEVKLKRAIHGLIADVHENEINDYQSDYNGSAKVAMIALNESISSLKVIAEFFPAESEIIKQLIHRLEEVHVLTNRYFPHMDKFIRPGFDKRD